MPGHTNTVPTVRTASQLWRRLGATGLALLLVVCATSWAAPFTVPRDADRLDITGLPEGWIDESGRATVDRVADAGNPPPLKPTGKATSHQLGEGALWLRLPLGPLPADERWYLEVSFHGVDRVSLFHQDAQGQWIGQHAGDLVPVSRWPVRHRIPVFEIKPPDAERVYWLRIANRPIPVSPQLTLLREDAFDEQRAGGYLLLGAYFGLALLVVYLSAISARQYADRAFAIYCLYASSMLMIQMCFTGVGGLYLWPNSPWWNNAAPYVFSQLSCTAGTLLVREVGSVSRFSGRMDRLMIGWALFGVLWAVVFVLVPERSSFAVLTVYQASTMVLVVSLCFWAWQRGERWGLWLGLGFMPVLLTAPMPILRNLGLLPASMLTQYSLAVGAALEIPLQLWVLSRRARENSEARLRARAMDSVDPLTGLPATEVLQFRLRDALVRGRRFKYRCAVLGVEVTNHGQLMAEYGREVADRAVVLAGARLLGVARDVDTVARVGAHRFVMLMEGPVSAAQAVAMATQAVAHGLNPSPKLPGGVVLKFHVVSAMAPDAQSPQSHDAGHCIEWLLAELSQMRSDGPKTIVHLNY